jgi:hypothetical protein
MREVGDALTRAPVATRPKTRSAARLTTAQATVRGDVRARAQVVRDPFFLVVVVISVRRRRIGRVSLPPSASVYSQSLSSAYGGDEYDASRSRRSPARSRCSCSCIRPRAHPGLPHSVSPLTAALVVVVRGTCDRHRPTIGSQSSPPAPRPPHPSPPSPPVRVPDRGQYVRLRIACVSAFVVLMGCRLAVEWGAEERKTRRPVPFRVRYGRRARPPPRGDAAKKAGLCAMIYELDVGHKRLKGQCIPESESSVRGARVRGGVGRRWIMERNVESGPGGCRLALGWVFEVNADLRDPLRGCKMRSSSEPRRLLWSRTSNARLRKERWGPITPKSGAVCLQVVACMARARDWDSEKDTPSANQ